VAAYSHPRLVEAYKNGKRVLQLADDIAASSKEKIRLILRIGLLHGHDSLVLSAFGCGAFCNPPYHIAQLFWEVIEHQFFHSFKHICFAIFDDHNTRQQHNPLGNVLPFQQVLGLASDGGITSMGQPEIKLFSFLVLHHNKHKLSRK